MLELDIVLERFLARHLEKLPLADQSRFKALLEYSDNDLWDLISEQLEADSPEDARILGLIRAP